MQGRARAASSQRKQAVPSLLAQKHWMPGIHGACQGLWDWFAPTPRRKEAVWASRGLRRGVRRRALGTRATTIQWAGEALGTRATTIQWAGEALGTRATTIQWAGEAMPLLAVPCLTARHVRGVRCSR